MGLQGYVGSGEDVRRIRRQEQQREEERKKTEAAKQQREANISAAGFRQFGKAAAEVRCCLKSVQQVVIGYSSYPFAL